MPQVRCHIHRSSGSKLRPQCFFTPLELGLPLMSLYLRPPSFTQVCLQRRAASSLQTPLTPLSFSTTRTIGVSAALLDSDKGSGIESSVGPPGHERGGYGTRSRSAEITRSRQQRGGENELVVCESSELGCSLSVGGEVGEVVMGGWGWRIST